MTETRTSLDPDARHKLDGLFYRLRGMGSAVQLIGLLVEKEGGPDGLGDLDHSLQAIGETITAAVGEMHEEVCRITGTTI